MTKCAPAFLKMASTRFDADFFSAEERRSHSFSLTPNSELPSITPTDQTPEFYKKIGYTYLQQVEKNEGGYGELFYKEVD